MPSNPADSPRTVGRYVIHQEIGSGGMAVVHMGRLQGSVGFARTVAIKRLHDQFARDPEFVEMMIDEARLAARIQHPNVVPILDVVALQGELFLVLEYVHGVPLTRILRRARQTRTKISPRIAVAIGSQMLAGLHAVHEARRETGEALGIVHRDINPQNVMVGADGVARILDLGIAKARHRYHHTGTGVVKGKLKYMAPEQVAGKEIDRRTDVFAASAVIWEMLAGETFIKSETPQAILDEIVKGDAPAPSSLSPDVSQVLDCVVLTGVAPYPAQRYQTAAEMAADLETACPPATPREVGELVAELCGDFLEQLADKRSQTERAATMDVPPPPPPLAPSTPSSGSHRVEVVQPPAPNHTPSSGSHRVELAAAAPPVAEAAPPIEPAPPPAVDAEPALAPLLAAQVQPAAPAADFPRVESSSSSQAYGGLAASNPPLPAPGAHPRASLGKRMAILAAVFLGAAMLTVAGATLVSAPSPTARRPQDISPASGLPEQPPATAIQVATATATANDPVPAPAAQASDVASATPSAAPEPLAAAAFSAAPSASASAKKPKPVFAPGAGCRPPYTIGADGVKRFKPECF